jgi:hypothetical protein
VAPTPGPARAEHLYRWAGIDRGAAGGAGARADARGRQADRRGARRDRPLRRDPALLRRRGGAGRRARWCRRRWRARCSSRCASRSASSALITPWNFPAAIPLWKAAPALAFGNTVVLKPAEQASRMAVLLAETAVDAGCRRACSTSCTAPVRSSATRCMRAGAGARGQLHGLDHGRGARRGGVRGSATSATRRRWAARTSSSCCRRRPGPGGAADGRGRDALRRTEVHGDQPRSRGCARSRMSFSSGCA